MKLCSVTANDSYAAPDPRAGLASRREGRRRADLSRSPHAHLDDSSRALLDAVGTRTRPPAPRLERARALGIARISARLSCPWRRGGSDLALSATMKTDTASPSSRTSSPPLPSAGTSGALKASMSVGSVSISWTARAVRRRGARASFYRVPTRRHLDALQRRPRRVTEPSR